MALSYNNNLEDAWALPLEGDTNFWSSVYLPHKSSVYRDGCEQVWSSVHAYIILTLKQIFARRNYWHRHYHDVRVQCQFWRLHWPVWLVVMSRGTRTFKMVACALPKTFKMVACALSMEPRSGAAVEMSHLGQACDGKLIPCYNVGVQ